jgi:putative oxidoreductase
MSLNPINLIFGPADTARRNHLADWGLFFLRVSTGAMMLFGHGLGKLSSYDTLASQFPDPLGVGPQASLALVVFAEFFCALALILGLATRAAAISLVINMSVAAFVVLGSEPWQKREFALLYLVPFVTILVAGPGRLALDSLVRARARPRIH